MTHTRPGGRHSRHGVASLVLALTIGLAATACGDDGPDDTASPQGSPSASPTAPGGEADPEPAPAPEDLVADSLCGGIDGDELARIYGQQGAFDVTAGTATVGIPSFDTCTITVGSGGAASDVSFGWSVETMTPRDWTDIRTHEEKTNGRYAEIEDLDVGQGGYYYSRTGVALVGERVVRVQYAGESATKEQTARALALAVPLVPELPESEPVRALPECEALSTEAEEVLGAAATIRRDNLDDRQDVACGWATPAAAVSITASRVKDAEAILDDDVQLFGGEAIQGLGRKAAYFGGVDGTSVRVVLGPQQEVRVSVPALLPGSRAALVALAEKAVDLY